MAPGLGSMLLQDRVKIHYKEISNYALGPNYYKCLLNDKCKPVNGKKQYNLVGHLKTAIHIDFFKEKYKHDSKKSLAAERLEYIQHCTELVTVNSEPFALLSKSGFLKMNAEKLQMLKDSGFDTGLSGPNFTAVKQQIEYLAGEIMKKTKSEVNGKFLSLMVDGATKHQRSILGIYIQYMLDSKIVTRSIGMTNLASKHSGKHLADVIRERLALIGVETSQVIAITTDNGSNMTAMIGRLNEAADNEDGEDAEPESPAAIQEIDADSAPFNFSPNKDYDQLLEGVVQNFEIQEIINAKIPDTDDSAICDSISSTLNDIISAHKLFSRSVRCAAHTLQLAVNSALGEKAYKLIIGLCKAVCKELRDRSVGIKMRELGISFRMPRIDCATRWGSTYIMVCSIYFLVMAKLPKNDRMKYSIRVRYEFVVRANIHNFQSTLQFRSNK